MKKFKLKYIFGTLFYASAAIGTANIDKYPIIIPIIMGILFIISSYLLYEDRA